MALLMMDLDDDMMCLILAELRDPLDPGVLVVLKRVCKRFRDTPKVVTMYQQLMALQMNTVRMMALACIDSVPYVDPGYVLPAHSLELATSIDVGSHDLTPDFDLKCARALGAVIRLNGLRRLRNLHIHMTDVEPVLRGILENTDPRRGAFNLETLVICHGARSTTNPSEKLAPLLAEILKSGAWKKLKALRILLPCGGFTYADFNTFAPYLCRATLPSIESIEITHATA